MNHSPIITSLLQTDAYKVSMLQVMLHHMAGNSAEYRFVCRGRPALALAALVHDLNEQLDHLCTLRYADDELAYLATLRWLKPDFIEFLRIFRLQRRLITARAEGEQLVVKAKGPQVHVMGFDIFVLAIVNQLYFERLVRGAAREQAQVTTGCASMPTASDWSSAMAWTCPRPSACTGTSATVCLRASASAPTSPTTWVLSR